ncbi:hypothetical protein HYPSUDRAFT_199361 [Hypholoma sublateritium FD-334 SS-4]|uniref:TPR-like protein n=1 Tax=Hypholoma sublateritium (strain FD-334 SS-4) TaxID=945553 RepID=A0A0D2Q3J0_HYPSF|nr:hypothetical protein HYPSUDRAFT_199361 [Hypholoma sublateritium FD-334 SS-4]
MPSSKGFSVARSLRTHIPARHPARACAAGLQALLLAKRHPEPDPPSHSRKPPRSHTTSMPPPSAPTSPATSPTQGSTPAHPQEKATDDGATSPPPPADTDPDTDATTRALAHKDKGTAHFRGARWGEALSAYRAALACLPARPATLTPAPAPPTRDDELDGEAVGGAGGKGNDKGKGKGKEREEKEEVLDVSSPAVSAADKETARLRAVLHANIGACLLKLGDHKEAAQACTEALLDDPAYVKARERRAACNDIIGSWTSLTSVQEDYTALLALHPAPAAQADLRRKLAALAPRLAAAQKRETDEMLGKLKGLGNSILGNFGLSTDNFKFEPNGAGGYSLNFQQ